MTLQEACGKIGIEYKDVPANDKLHTTAVTGKNSKNTSGRIRLFPDGAGGIVMNNVEGSVLTFWHDDTPPTMTAADKATRAARIAKEAQEKAEMHRKCRDESLHLFNTVARQEIPADHSYFVSKNTRPFGIRWQSSGDLLVIPVQDLAGIIHGLQFIAPDGSKKFKTGTNKTGHFFKIGTSKDNTIIICEGYATGASIHQATGHAVVIAFDAGNLLSVAQAVRSKFSDMKIILAADDDHATVGNPGLTKATEAARAVNGLLAIPVFEGVRHE